MFDFLNNSVMENRTRNKKTVRRLLDKYGTLDNFMQNSTMTEDLEYKLAQGDSIVDEVEQERQAMMKAMNSLPKQQGSSLDDNDMMRNARVNQARNEVVDSTDDDFLHSILKTYYPSVYRAIKEKDKVTPMDISDENKHQYISCVGSQGGLGSSIATLAGGTYKEAKDIYKKLSNPEERKKYGGSLGVLKDSAKDMKNNLYGAGYGLTYRQNGDCNSLLKHKIK